MVSSSIILVNHAKRKRLERLARQTHSKSVYRHCQIILLLAARRHPDAIAADLGCHVCTVYRMRRAYRQGGTRALLVKHSPGRPRALSPAQVQQLDQTVAQEPRALAQNFSNWSSKLLLIYLHWPVHAVTLWRYLRRLAWHWSRPVERVASPDPRYAAKARYLRHLRHQARQGRIHLYYADEMDVALLPTLSGRWMRCAEQVQVDTPGKNAKQYVFGAVHYTTGGLVWLPWTNKNNVGFRHLLTQVLAQHQPDGRRIVIAVDNFRIHNAKAVQAWLRSHREQIRLYFLPTYAPRLNPIERVWRHFRRHVTDNYFFRTMARLMTATVSFLNELAQSPDSVLRLVA